MVKGTLFFISVNNLFPKIVQWDKFTVELCVFHKKTDHFKSVHWRMLKFWSTMKKGCNSKGYLE